MKNYFMIPQKYWAGYYKDLDDEREAYKYFKEIDKERERKTIEAIVRSAGEYDC